MQSDEVVIDSWRSLGREIPLHARTFEDIGKAVGFYRVEERPLFTPPFADAVPDYKALVRQDTGDALSVVGSSYVPIQFDQVAATLVGAADEVGLGRIFRTAGLFGKNGRKAWLLADLGEPIRVRGDLSPIRKYLLGVAGHGDTAILLKNCATRVWCRNCIGTALGEANGALWRITHTKNAALRLDHAARGLRALVREYDRFGELANHLAEQKFSEQQMAAVVDAVLPLPSDGLNHARLIGSREKMASLFETGVGIDQGIRGTAWAALNAVVEYTDHHRQTRGGARDVPRAQLESVWLGAAARQKEAGMQAVLKQAGVRLSAA